MKKLILALLFVAAGLALEANPICYFTYSQARRTVLFLNTQNELVVYCGHAYELETYVIVSDVWQERVNSRYYEVWLYGIDAYTGDEIVMPIDLSCIWLLDRWSNEMYNAASYLHFHCDAPYTTLVWTMPSYHSFVRVAHPSYYRRSYHYDIHRHGWHPTPEVGLPVYYMRPPTAPMPVVVTPYVPGRERPTVQVNNSVTPRPQPTTSRTASTSVRSSSTPASTSPTRIPSTNVRTGDNPRPQPTTTTPSTGSVNTRTSSTPTRTTSTTTGTTTTTPTTTRPSTSRPTTTPSTTNTTTTTPSRSTTSRPHSTTAQPTTTPSAAPKATPTSTTTRSSSTSRSTSTFQQRTTSNTDRPTSTTNRTSSTSRR